jgi:transcription elongation factor GreB
LSKRDDVVPQRMTTIVLRADNRVGTMSKAFKGEDASEAPLLVPPRAPLPDGQPNYVTPRGLAALRREHEALAHERARLESAEGGEDRTRALAAIGLRLAALDDRLACAQVVDPAGQPRDEVRFGATVTLRGASGDERRYTIVGVDEADAKAGRLAFAAPLARALLGKRAGEFAAVRTPRGEEEWAITRVAYDEDEASEG